MIAETDWLNAETNHEMSRQEGRTSHNCPEKEMFLADIVEQASNDDGNYLEMESEEEEVQQNWLLEEDADANDEEVVEKSQTEKRI